MVRREVAAWLAGWNTKGIVGWARLHGLQSRAHPRSGYLATLAGATGVPVALGAVVAAAAAG